MAWSFSLDAIRLEAQESANVGLGLADTVEAEMAGRCYRWLDEPELAAKWTHRAAAARQEVMRDKGTGTGADWARVGGLLVKAGESELARPWLEGSLVHELSIEHGGTRTEVLYVLGRLEDVASSSDESLRALASARLTGETGGIDAVRSVFVAGARGDRIGPHEESSHEPWSTWDWIEETFVLEAELLGTPVLSHADMLDQCGVLKKPKARRTRAKKGVAPLPEPGTEIGVPLTAADGASVTGEAIRDVELVLLVLDPRPERYLAVALDEIGGEWGTVLHQDEGSTGVAMHASVFSAADEAAEAAAEWLSVHVPEPHDGRTSAQAVRTLFAALRR